ncbi:cutinase [Plectosphaerella plurivora]|uniref:Cutinase n=1 Tax=Plectosphaerella plurivora TaxID=936078 RepID=A0A9P8VAX6_9PEZI|nr:cutinase [Plectosphaerella plurivora]
MSPSPRYLSLRRLALVLGAVTLSSVHALPAVDATIDNDPMFIEARQIMENSLALSQRQNFDIPEGLAQFPSGPLNMFLRIISTLPVGEKALDAVGKILTPLQQSLADSAGIETTRNDLARNAPCADVTVIFARGTTEPGNVGLVAAPPFLDALATQLGSKTLAAQGVEYPATFAGFNDNGVNGVPSMTSFINQAGTNCPATKIVLSGYSQGALVLRSTADTLPAATMARISSIVTFGDPRNPQPITGGEGKTLIICQESDAVCSGGFINVAHLTYGANATVAAQFVVEKASG